MAIKPILFNSHMVRAILDGRKTATRRVVKPQPVSKLAYCIAGYKHGTWGYPSDDVWKYWGDAYKRDTPIPENERFHHWTPPCHTDDVLWVRESWAKCQNSESYVYKADFDGYASDVFLPLMKWRPSIHMPKEAARIWLRVTDVRVERLQEIDDTGAKAEGANWKNGKNVGWEEKMRRSSIERFADIWDSTIKPADRERYGWAANPWVWVIEFERCEKPEQ